MTWHVRPVGPSAFPNGTAAQWATAWFTPIDHTHLNYLKDNLEFLRTPPRSFAETTPTTTFAGSGTSFYSSATPVLNGTLTGYAGGKVYLFLSAELLAPVSGGLGQLMLQLTNAGGTFYVNTRGTLKTVNTTGTLEHRTQPSAVHLSVSAMFIIDPSALIGNDITWGLRFAGGATASVKNVKIFLREL